MVESLRLAHRDDKSLGQFNCATASRRVNHGRIYATGTREQACLSLDHLCRIVKVKSSKLITPTKTRRIPKYAQSLLLQYKYINSIPLLTGFNFVAIFTSFLISQRSQICRHLQPCVVAALSVWLTRDRLQAAMQEDVHSVCCAHTQQVNHSNQNPIIIKGGSMYT